GVRAFRLVDVEEGLNLAQDPVERTGLVAGSSDRVAVHRVARPYDLAAFALNSLHQLGQVIANLLGTKARDQGQATRFVLRVQEVDQVEQTVSRQRRTALKSQRVLDAAAIFNMRVVG